MGDNLWDEDVLDEVGRFLKHVNASSKRGSVSNAVLAQRLSEALASRAKRVSERRSEGSMGSAGVFAKKEPTPLPFQPTAMAGASGILHDGQLPPTPPPTPKVQAKNHHPGDGFGGDGEYGGAGKNTWWGFEAEEEEEPEWVADEIPFGRKARESGLRFAGGKEDGQSSLRCLLPCVPC